MLPLFIFDKNILEKLEDKDDPRVTFIYDSIIEIQDQLKKMGTSMMVRYGKPLEVWAALIKAFRIKAVFTNRDFEPYALERDEKVKNLLSQNDIAFHSFKDHVIFEKGEVLKEDGTPYTVFTPYSKKWKTKLSSRIHKRTKQNDLKPDTSFYVQSYPVSNYFDRFKKTESFLIPALEDLGFERNALKIPEKKVIRGLIKKYGETRDFPSVNGTSRLGIHFRFGTISIREKARKALILSEIYLNELIWRDFYSMILAHFPHVVNAPFRKKYEWIEWRNNETEFEQWCQGKTGYPIVDAGMRELNETGHMHNRVRMITASFLTKHLLIDWRWGEAYFARKLLDFDLASNNGGWQWAAGCGTDAAPYFRIFNPISQQQKFDKDFKYIKKWVPEYGTDNYLRPIVDHKMAREHCLKVYKSSLANAGK